MQIACYHFTTRFKSSDCSMPRPTKKPSAKQPRSRVNSKKTARKQSKSIGSVSWSIQCLLGFLWRPVLFLMATCTTAIAGLGKFCRRPTNEMSAFVRSSCSPPDDIPEKERGMLGAATAIPLNLYKHVKDLLAGSRPDNNNGTSQPLLSHSEQPASSGTASPTSDDILLPQLSTSFDEKLVDGKEKILAHDRAPGNETPAEDVIKCQNASFLSKKPRQPTKNKGKAVNKENKKATSTQKAQPSLAKPKLSQTHLNDDTKARRGSHGYHQETTATKQNTIGEGPLAGPATKPKPKVPTGTSAKSGLWQPRELPRDTSKQERHRKNQKESHPKKVPSESLKPPSEPSMKYPAGLVQNTALFNKPSSQAAPLNIPEMPNTSNMQPLGTDTSFSAGQSNAPSHKLSYKPQMKPESSKKQTVSPQGKSGQPENSAAQAGPLEALAPQTTNKQHPQTGASLSEVPNISSNRHIDEPQPKSKIGTQHTVGLKKTMQLSSKPSPRTVQPNVPVPENTSDKQPLKGAARTSKPPSKLHRPTDKPQPKPEPTSKKQPVGISQKTKLPQNPSQRAPSKAPVPNTNKQPSGTVASSDQAASNITAHRPRNRMKKISDPSSKKHPVNLHKKTGLPNTPSSQRAPSKAPAPRNTRKKQPSKTAAKPDDTARSIPSDMPRKRPQPKYTQRSKKRPTDLQEKTGWPNKPSSQRAPSKAPAPKTSNKQPSKTAAISDEPLSNISSHKPRNAPHYKYKPSRCPVDLQEKTGLPNKPSLLRSPRESSPQNISDEQPPRTTASYDEAPWNIPSQKVTDRSGSDHKTPSISTAVDNSADREKGMKPGKRLPTVKRSQEEPKEDAKLENISRMKAAEEAIGGKDKQQKDSAKEMNHQAESPRDSETDVTKPSMMGLNVAGHNSKPGPQKMKALDSQDLPSGQWPQMVSARIEGFGPAVIINARKIQPQVPHKAPHKKKSLLDTVHKIMEACAKMAHLLEASSTDEDSSRSEAGGSSPNSVPAKPKLGDNDMNTACENYSVRKKHHELPSADGNEQNDKNLSLKKTLMSEKLIGTTGEIFRWSTGVKNTPPLLHNLHKPPPRVTDQGTQTEKNRLTQTKGVSTDCTDLLPQQTGHVTNNKEQKCLQIDLPKNNVTSVIQLLEEKARQGSDELAYPKEYFHAAGTAQNSGARNGEFTKSENNQSSVVQEDQPLPIQNTGAATPIDCPKTPPPIKLPNGSSHVSSVVDLFEKNAEQQDRNGPTSSKLHSRSRGVPDQKPATYHDGNTTQKAEAMNVVQPYAYTRKAANAPSSGLATHTDISNNQQSVMHLDVPRNASSLVQLLEENAQKWNKAVSHKLVSKPARTALQRTKDDDTSRSEDVQASACQEDQPWPCLRPRMFRRTVSTPKKTHHTTFR